jgi:hypothetical protein
MLKPIHGCRFGRLFRESKQSYGLRCRVQNPQLLDPLASINLTLGLLVEHRGARRENLNDEVGSAFGASLREYRGTLTRYKEDVRLKNIVLSQVNIKRSVIKFPDGMPLQVLEQEELEIRERFW